MRRLHEKLFYRPLLQAVARLDAGEARLSLEAAEQRLEALGYIDPQSALRHLQALTAGVSRRAAIQRTLLPVMLGWFADAPDPDAGLLGFRRVSDALGSTHWYLRLLRDESAAAERLARVLATSRYATDLLLEAPESVSMLADEADLVPRSRAALLTEVLSVVDRHEEPASAVAAIRSIRRRELFRIAVAELLHVADPEQAGRSLSDVAVAALEGAVRVARSAVDPGGSVDFAVIGMGRFGGRELGFGSDIDVMFVYEARPGVDDETALRAAAAIAEELRRLLMAPSGDPPLDIDADLRPEGKQGPLVRSLGSYAAYYERWSSTWEAQALLRADMVAGDEGPRGVLPRDHRPPAVDRPAHRRRRDRGPPAEGPHGVRAAAARGGPEPAHQARAWWAQRRRVGRAAAADDALGRRRRRCGPPARWTHSRRLGRRA